jgi:hypothetical protein
MPPRARTASMNPMNATLRVFALVLLLVAGCTRPAPVAPAPDLVFVIPRGTAQAELRGEAAPILPSPVKLKVGQRVVIHNEDQAMHYFFEMPVAPGQELVKSYDQPGRFTYTGMRSCSVGGLSSLSVEITP